MCQVAGVPFFFKQGSRFLPGGDRQLDGRTWDEVPAAFRPGGGEQPETTSGEPLPAVVQLALPGF